MKLYMKYSNFFLFFQQKKFAKSILDIPRKHQKTPYIKTNSWGGHAPKPPTCSLKANTIVARNWRSQIFKLFSKATTLTFISGGNPEIATDQ